MEHPTEEMHSLDLTYNGVAVGLAFFLFRPSVCIMEEYTPLYLKQLGYNATFIGLVPILGLFTQIVGIPLLNYLADKYRARKLFLFLCILISIPCALLFLAAAIPKPICEVTMQNQTLGNNTIVASWNTTHRYNHSSFVVKRSVDFSSFSDTNETSSSDLKIKPDDKLDSHRIGFFVLFLILRGIFELTKRLTVTLITVAAMTHLKQDESKFGYYACWGELGGGLALFIVGMSLSHIVHSVCSVMVPDYVVIFFFVVGYQFFTLFTLPLMSFEYLNPRMIDYNEVKKVFKTFHYLLILIICCHSGWCSAFQTRWEFWYMEKLGGSSIVMAVGGLLRRPSVAVWFLLSRRIIGYFGELKVIALALFIFSGSFVGLAFIENAWLVILFDNFQAAAYVLAFSSFVVHFSDVGSKESTAFFRGNVYNKLPFFNSNIFMIKLTASKC